MLEFKNLEKMNNVESIEDIDFLAKHESFDYDNTIILGYIKITKNEENRLDIISKKIYGQFGFIEQICEFNGILNPNAVFDGDILAIPDIGSMQDNLEIIEFQEKFIASNVTSFSTDGNILIRGQKKLPNRKISTTKNFRSDVKNGVIVL